MLLSKNFPWLYLKSLTFPDFLRKSKIPRVFPDFPNLKGTLNKKIVHLFQFWPIKYYSKNLNSHCGIIHKLYWNLSFSGKHFEQNNFANVGLFLQNRCQWCYCQLERNFLRMFLLFWTFLAYLAATIWH